jgi:hypothetical protein
MNWPDERLLACAAASWETVGPLGPFQGVINILEV